MGIAVVQDAFKGIGALTLALGVCSGVALGQANSQHYLRTDLTSNDASLAPMHDQNLVNPWGLSRSTGGPWWVSDNGTGLSTLYDGTGATQPLVVKIPAADPSQTGSPTGTVFNGGTGFAVKGGPSVFLFVTEDGTISGWNPGGSLTNAVIAVNEKNKSVYKGATIATAKLGEGSQQYLYVADFHHARVQIFDSSFHHVKNMEEAFELPGEDQDGGDDRVSKAGYAPFNVQNIGGNIYVAYAKQDAAKFNEVDGAGLGFVEVYTPEGKRLGQLQRGNYFNAPWGLALASGDFGAYSHDLLVGQFGSGEILVFDPLTFRFKGRLRGADNAPIKIDGLWGLSFGNGKAGGPATSLYFAAGVNQETGGLFGSIAAIENAQGNDQ